MTSNYVEDEFQRLCMIRMTVLSDSYDHRLYHCHHYTITTSYHEGNGCNILNDQYHPNLLSLAVVFSLENS